MLRSRAATLFALLLLGGCTHPWMYGMHGDGAWHAPGRDYIEVQGEGEAKAAPDSFRVRATANAEGDNVDALKRQVDGQVNRVLKLARSLGIANKDIQALALRVTPQWQYQPKRQLTGYRAERPMTITVHNLALWGKLLSGLTEAGVTDIQPAGAFVANSGALEKQALQAAVNDARHRAEIMAHAAGRRLGDALRITEQGGQSPRPVAMNALRESSKSRPYEAGEVTVQRHVTVRFELR